MFNAQPTSTVISRWDRVGKGGGGGSSLVSWLLNVSATRKEGEEGRGVAVVLLHICIVRKE